MRRRWNPLSRKTRWSNHQNSSTKLITTDMKGHFEISSACNFFLVIIKTQTLVQTDVALIHWLNENIK